MDSKSSSAVKEGLIFFNDSLKDLRPVPASHSATALRIARDMFRVGSGVEGLI